MEISAARPHPTLAAASRERRDIVSGEVMEEARLIRFVSGPDGQAVPDLARKLPGRGMWVAADRASVTTAAKKGLFARSAKAKISAAADLADHATDDALTAREIDVLRLIAAGNANKNIADQLAIGEATVKTHVTNIMSKLGANDRTHAVTIGLKRGIIDLHTR